MKLLHYLDQNLYTLEQVLDLSNIEISDFRRLQAQRMMPKYSYELSLNLTCHSYFGEHQESCDVEYYAKGYVKWLVDISNKHTEEQAFSLFEKRYRQQLSTLNSMGYRSHIDEFNSELSTLITEQWKHFISGIYGLCTKSGLPEDIATKEIAITIIESLDAQKVLSVEDRQHLRNAINLLDQASSLFAPHERLRSSRYSLVDQVRKKYDL